MPPKVIARKSALHGRGLFAARDLAADERLIEYTGQRYAKGEFPDMKVDGLTKFLGLSDGTGIDGTGWAALANHSCEPNCELREEVGTGRNGRSGHDGRGGNCTPGSTPCATSGAAKSWCGTTAWTCAREKTPTRAGPAPAAQKPAAAPWPTRKDCANAHAPQSPTTPPNPKRTPANPTTHGDGEGLG